MILFGISFYCIFIYLFYVLVSVYVGGAYGSAHVGVRGQPVGSTVSFYRLGDGEQTHIVSLVADVFTFWTISKDPWASS